jgi:hypothetical protein
MVIYYNPLHTSYKNSTARADKFVTVNKSNQYINL